MPASDSGERSVLEGRHAVSEALAVGRPIDKLYLLKGASGDSVLSAIRTRAQAAGIPVVEADRHKLDAMSQTGAHQGVIAAVPAAEYASVEDILRAAEADTAPALIVLCDGLSDPHNLGAIVRTAGAAGAHGVIIPKHRSVSLTAACAKAAAGALEHVPVARVTNLAETIVTLQKRGIWVFGTAGEATTSLYDADFNRPAAIVIGNEGSGLSRLVRERCDYLVSIPMKGAVPSLNASAAAAVVLFEAVRRRLGHS
ncbi:MAG: 23S rRNA (guanosine(2251)-2'-O)-methyltransferase RlmB [Eubacteriales bacterium]|nr:23S rRNA (guanosine(2251)-2'-O)-methyltransferase RlmB [Clostridiales bacterium]MDY3285250.1 23S rRNA (guanosine(2251)-2'-O)-methyltransferase RlmB [Eubacteriales bacterium]